MKLKYIHILLFFLPLLCFAQNEKGEKVELKTTFLNPLQKRDSVLIADQFEYGFTLDKVQNGTQFIFPEYKDTLIKNIEIVKAWSIDTLKAKKKYNNIKAKIIITSFEEGKYNLPSLQVLRLNKDKSLDTLIVEAKSLEYKTIQIDTAKFELHDIKGQIKYPITFKEVLPYILCILWIIGIILITIYLYLRWKRNKKELEHKEPAHIIALRKLDTYTDNKYWQQDKQKLFYSAVTDILREYIEERYKIDALEMTTAEILAKMKKKDIKADLYMELDELFRRADFVKFAKHIASDEENAKVLPFAVRFVTTTYQEILIEQNNNDMKAKDLPEDESNYMPKSNIGR